MTAAFKRAPSPALFKTAIGLTLVIAMIAIVVAVTGRGSDASTIDQVRLAWRDLQSPHPVSAALSYFLLYFAVAALSVPVATSLTLIAGWRFGLVQGAIIVSLASASGATLAMLASRCFLREFVERKFGPLMEKINRGAQRDGARYLLALRLVSIVPFFVVNLVMGLTQMKARTFAWVSLLGMLRRSFYT